MPEPCRHGRAGCGGCAGRSRPRPRPPAPAAAAARTGEACDLCGTDAAGGPPPHAPHGGAPDRVHVRGVLGAALGRSGVQPGRHAGGVAARAGDERRALGRLQHPDRAGVLHAQHRRRAAWWRMYPSPAGATESALDESVWAALVDENPVLEGLESDAEGLVVNRLAEPAELRHRADRRVLQAGRPGEGELGGHLGRRPARGRHPRLLRGAARKGGVEVNDGGRGDIHHAGPGGRVLEAGARRSRSSAPRPCATRPRRRSTSPPR